MCKRKNNWVDRVRPLLRILNKIEVSLLRSIGHSPLSLVNRGDVLVLEATGRRSGRQRSVAVGYSLTPEGAIVIGGGAAGMTTDPDWVKNLRADPRAAVWIRRSRASVTAHELTGARASAQAHAETIWKMIPTYQRRSGRVIPHFRLVATDPFPLGTSGQ